MYELRPIITFDGDIVLETCMYKMQSFHKDDEKVKSSSTDCGGNSGTFQLVERFSKNNELAEMAELETRQEKLLRELQELKAMMLSIKAELNCSKSLETVPTIQKAAAVVDIPDIVLKVNPLHPPYFLQFLQRLLTNVSLNINFYLHSSVSKIPPKTQEFVDNLQHFPTNGVPSVNIRIIWKQISLSELSSSPCPVQGEANILRYIARVFDNFYENFENVDKIDMILDLSYKLSLNSKKYKDILHLLNKYVGKTKWLCGNNITIADVAMYDCLKKHVNLNDINGNLNKWFNQCEKYVK